MPAEMVISATSPSKMTSPAWRARSSRVVSSTVARPIPSRSASPAMRPAKPWMDSTSRRVCPILPCCWTKIQRMTIGAIAKSDSQGVTSAGARATPAIVALSAKIHPEVRSSVTDLPKKSPSNWAIAAHTINEPTTDTIPTATTPPATIQVIDSSDHATIVRSTHAATAISSANNPALNRSLCSGGRRVTHTTASPPTMRAATASRTSRNTNA